MKTNTEVKCFFCGKEEKLYLIEFNEYVCAKDRERIEKFLKRIKTKPTRYQSAETFINTYKLTNAIAGQDQRGVREV